MSGWVVEAAGTEGTRQLVERALARLRDEGRHAIRIVDIDCGTGRRLAGVVRLARAMGFTAIEARGCAASREAAHAAAAASARHPDAGVGWGFDAVDVAEALASEQAEGDADLILAPRPVAAALLGVSADLVIPIGRRRRDRAAQAGRPQRRTLICPSAAA
ncbi:SAM-dependent methyltransferase [uncultured Sphingomonas sp.]|uniref:SAM-dependent methyltransferase n=1 Tax=uncultured Sphingomonas sp. TaxID=158754 RepID=UPI0035CC21FA